MKREILDRLLQARAAKLSTVLVTEISSGRQTLVVGETETGDLPLGGAARTAVAAARLADRSTSTEIDGSALFIDIYNPPLRMAIVGAVHIAQPLATVAALTGYDVTVIDPRSSFASGERFPGVSLSTEWPDEALTQLGPDRRTAIITLTHDPKLDDPALTVALRSDAFYVGALGSRRTHSRRKDRLTAAGFDDAAFSRIRGPVGLAIGAISPAEIAISIMAEVTQILRGAPAPKAPAPEAPPPGTPA